MGACAVLVVEVVATVVLAEVDVVDDDEDTVAVVVVAVAVEDAVVLPVAVVEGGTGMVDAHGYVSGIAVHGDRSE